MIGRSVSVVVPALNASATIGAQLEALDGQDHAGELEVIVVDNASDDDTRAVVERFAPRRCVVRVVSEPRRGVNLARNAGVAAARSDIVLLCDADDVVQPGWVSAIAGGVGPTTFAAGPVDYATLNTARTRRLWAAPALSVEPSWTFGGNCGFSKAMWSELQGFNPSLSGHGDETEFFVRAEAAGYRQVHVPNALVAYRLRPGLLAMLRTRYRQGRSAVGGRDAWRTDSGEPPGAGAVVARLARLIAVAPRSVLRSSARYEWLAALARQFGMLAGHRDLARSRRAPEV